MLLSEDELDSIVLLDIYWTLLDIAVTTCKKKSDLQTQYLAKRRVQGKTTKYD